jgi:DNA gyrase/topoisomerase IV subunit B
MNGYGKKISIRYNDNIFEISDEGRGIPFSETEEGKMKYTQIFNDLHTGGKYDKVGYKTSGGQHGLGIKSTNALSEFFEAWSWRDGKKAKIRFERGIFKELTIVPEKSKSGTVITFKPDIEIFKDGITLPDERIIDTLTRFSYLCPKLTFEYKGQKYMSQDGLSDYVKELNKGYKTITSVGQIMGEVGDTLFDMAFQWNDSGKTNFALFTNNIPNDSGTHLTGLKTGLNAAFKQVSDEKITSENILRGMTFVLSLTMAEPQYNAQNKRQLMSTSARKIVNDLVSQKLGIWLKSNKDDADKIIKYALLELKAEAAAEKARQRVKEAKDDYSKKKISASDKLIDTDHKKRDECELYITEGLSASSTLKKVKPSTAAIMMLRGKVLNVARTDFESVIKNEELSTLAKALGASIIGEKFSLLSNKTRYGKIIIFADSDEDGFAIEALVLTFFYQYFPQLFTDGKIYAMEPKLFGLHWKKNTKFFSTEKELQTFIKTNKITKPEISRYKGLGSYQENEFASIISPEERVLRQFTIKDAQRAKEAIALMESNMEARRKLVKGDFEFSREEKE